MFRSIHAKLMLIIAAISLLTAGFFMAVVYLSVHRSYYGPVEEFIAGRAQAAAAYYRAMTPSGDAGIDAGNIAFVFADERLRIQVIDAENTVLADTSAPSGGGHDSPEAGQALSGSASRRTYVDKQSGGRIMAYAAPLERGGRVSGCVRISVLLREVDAEIARLMLRYGLIGLGALALATSAGALLSRTIVRPLRRVTAAAARLGGGDLSARALIASRDEVGQLADAFNRMAEGLERGERLKTEFISQVSHELRTPLTSIIGWAVTVRDGAFGDAHTAGHGLDIILSEAERLREMVEELLDFSRLQAGGFTLSKSRIDLAAPCRDAVEAMLPRGRRGKVDLVLLAEDGVFAHADEGRIKQILLNLIDNALKHTRAGGRVEVSCARSGAHVRIVVADDGEGIAPDALPHVKERFFSGGSARGAGLGLAICDQLARMHGGQLDIESQPGAGTRVYLTLPAAE